jgi:hypothetical protein
MRCGAAHIKERAMDHDHLPGLMALMFAAPLAIFALAGVQLAARLRYAPAGRALARASAAPTSARLTALLLLIAGAVHAGLIAGHLEEPALAAAFLVAAVAMIGAAGGALLAASWWRPLAAALLVAVLVAYAATRAAGMEGVDVLGVATALVELSALATVLIGWFFELGFQPPASPC